MKKVKRRKQEYPTVIKAAFITPGIYDILVWKNGKSIIRRIR